MLTHKYCIAILFFCFFMPKKSLTTVRLSVLGDLITGSEQHFSESAHNHRISKIPYQMQ